MRTLNIKNNILESLEEKYNLDDKIKIYDQFIERQMSATQSEETRNFLIPIWRLRSSFNDALRPIEESMITSLLCREKMILATVAIRAGRVQDQNVFRMMAETRKCFKTYEEYLRRLKQLYTRTKHIFNTISYHKLDVLDEYAEVHHFDPIAVRHHYNRIVFVLEMSLVIGESILDAMKNAKSVVKCARENLETMAECYKNIIHLQQLEAENIIFPRCITTSAPSRSNTTASHKSAHRIPIKQIRSRIKPKKISLSPKPSTQKLLPPEASSEPRPKKLTRIVMTKPRVLTPHEISVVSYKAKAGNASSDSSASASSENASLNVRRFNATSNINQNSNNGATLIRIYPVPVTSVEELKALKKSRGRFKSQRETVNGVNEPEPILVTFDSPSSCVEYPEVGSPIIRNGTMGNEFNQVNSALEAKRAKSISRRPLTRAKSKTRLVALRKSKKMDR